MLDGVVSVPMSIGSFIKEAEKEFYSLCWVYLNLLRGFCDDIIDEWDQFIKIMEYQERYPDVDLRELLTVLAIKYADKNRLDFNDVWNDLFVLRSCLYVVNDEYYITSCLELAVFNLFDSILYRDIETNEFGLSLFSDDLDKFKELMSSEMGVLGEQYESQWAVRYVIALLNIFVILNSYPNVDFEPVWELLKSKIANYYDEDYLTMSMRIEDLKLQVQSWDNVYSKLLKYCPSVLGR